MPLTIVLLLRLLLAAASGAAIGAQRESKGRPAGLRTLALISLGAALFGVISNFGFAGGNPAMVAAGVVTGVGFLGAGAILHHDSGIEGMTTAATIWVSAGIGLAAGAGFYWISAIVTVIVLVILYIPHLEPQDKGKGK